MLLLDYDSPERRESSDQAPEEAGVPEDARRARHVADLLNGTDPAQAAAQGTRTKSRKAPARAADTERGR